MKVYTLSEAAELLRCSADCVRAHIAAGDIAARQIGKGTKRRRWIIPEASLNAFLSSEPSDKPKKRKSPPPVLTGKRFLK
jgi:excisionase family DNA binding protein